MTYTIQINGHKDTGSEDEARTFEEGIIEQAKGFVASLEGVNVATGSDGHVGTVNLKES